MEKTEQKIEVGNIINFPTDSSIRLLGTIRQIQKRSLKTSQYKVLSIYNDGKNSRIIIEKIKGKKTGSHDKCFDEEFLETVRQTNEYINP